MLERDGCSIDHATHNADVLIVQTAVGSAQAKDSVLIGDDTDVLILLLHHVEMDAHELFMAPEPKQSTKKKRVWCIKQSSELLGLKICDHLLFVHSILGCDTTSRLFGLGKGVVVKKIENDPTVQITFIFIDFRVYDFAHPAFRVLNVFYFQTDFNLRFKRKRDVRLTCHTHLMHFTSHIIAHMATSPYIALYRSN